MNETTLQRVVIVGAGQAGCEVAMELRRQKYAGQIVLIGDEPHPPYRRPPLSKQYLAGKAGDDELWVLPPERLAEMNVEVRLGQGVVRIERHDRCVVLDSGERLEFDVLVLATGGHARPLPVPGADAEGVSLFRTMHDAERVRAAVRPGQHVVIVGGGFIGLETASVLRGLGLRVTVLEAAPRVLARVTSAKVSAFFERVHREAGVEIRTGHALTGIAQESGGPLKLELSGGDVLSADLVIAGIGLIPNTALAETAGLEVGDGIVVDEYGRTLDPHIFAAGDCTWHPNPSLGRRLRLESLQNAMAQARCVARNVLGQAQVYDAMPWFWSDQYDLKLQMVGIADGYDQCVLRGDVDAGRDFAMFYLQEGRLIAADVVSRPQEFMVARKLVGTDVHPLPEQLADETRPLRELLNG